MSSLTPAENVALRAYFAGQLSEARLTAEQAAVVESVLETMLVFAEADAWDAFVDVLRSLGRDRDADLFADLKGVPLDVVRDAVRMAREELGASQ